MLKHLLFTAAVAASLGTALAADVGVSVRVGEPGFYGRIDIGNVQQAPQVIYPAPVIIQQAPIGLVRQPIYLRVPVGHQKHWNKHCHKYHACGQPVYFVQEDWYKGAYSNDYRRDRNGPRYDNDRNDRHDRNDHGHRDRRDNNQGDNGRGHDQGRKNQDHRRD